jgi:hypothetical protein
MKQQGEIPEPAADVSGPGEVAPLPMGVYPSPRSRTGAPLWRQIIIRFHFAGLPAFPVRQCIQAIRALGCSSPQRGHLVGLATAAPLNGTRPARRDSPRARPPLRPRTTAARLLRLPFSTAPLSQKIT